MRCFHCVCGNRIYFENDLCLACGRALGFDASAMVLRPIHPEDGLCPSRQSTGTCNWLITEAHQPQCSACELNAVIPDISDPLRKALFYEVEKAKRRLLFTLYSLGLPVDGRSRRRNGLAFEILADARLDHDGLVALDEQAVMTGHAQGTITINLLEADPAKREQMRMAMGEPYRTLLGHFRHESGHYYWHVLVENNCLDDFRAMFGDEREPYAESVAAHYREGPPDDWASDHVCAYATAHPFEDFAECWAHYLHMVDTLETAADAGLSASGRVLRDPLRGDEDWDVLVDNWRWLGSTMNDLSRSMGQGDPYPFALVPRVVEKLRFVHELVASWSRASGATAGTHEL